MTPEPLKDNLALRKAVALAINREAIEKAISRGEGGVMTGLEPPQSPAWSDTIVGHKYDPEGAKAAYAESGVTTLSAIGAAGTLDERTATLRTLAEALEAAGLTE